MLACLVLISGCRTSVRETSILTQQLRIKYPLIDGLSDKAAQARTNSILCSASIRLLDESADLVKGNEKGYSYYAEFKVTKRNADIISVRFDECLNIPRYAHPINRLCAVTIDLKAGKILELNDVFNPNINYRPILIKLLRKEMALQVQKLQVNLLTQFRGLDPEQGFYLTDDSIAFYWQEAEYFPRYLGPTVLHIRYIAIPGMVEPMSRP